MFGLGNRRRSSFSQNLWLFTNSVSNTDFNNAANNRQFTKSNENDELFDRIDQENCMEMDEAEPLQFCNLKENILRLEELAKKNGISLDDDRLDGNGQYFFQEQMNPRGNTFARRDSLGSTCWFNMGRRFSGLKPEHLPEENRLAQLVCQFGLEHVRELPDLPMEAINKCLLAV
jgi:hypothetical protein